MKELKIYNSLNEWEANKDNLKTLFLKEEYGFRDELNKYEIKYNQKSVKVVNNIIFEENEFSISKYTVPFFSFFPNDNKSHKTFIFILHEYAEANAKGDIREKFLNIPAVPIKEIIDRNYGIVLLPTRGLSPDLNSYDFDHTNVNNILDLLDDKNDKAGALQAWSFGVSKVIDYLEKDKHVDSKHIGVVGHSRGGKTALISGMQDERICLTVSSCSGCSGAAISRNNTGERISSILDHFGYWFCKNYSKYAENEENLPFDQHELLGLIAPRHLYVFSASEDTWACPKNELLACELASKIYNFYGVNGLIIPENYKSDISYNEGNIAYHIKTGNHSIELRDWNMIMDYFDKF